jgi:hypothetical protein
VECPICPLLLVARTQWMEPDKIDRARNVRNVEPSAIRKNGASILTYAIFALSAGELRDILIATGV